MNLGSVAGSILKGRVKRQGRIALLFATASVGYRVWQRVTRVSARPAIRFEVKPGEIYELMGLSRHR